MNTRNQPVGASVENTRGLNINGSSSHYPANHDHRIKHTRNYPSTKDVNFLDTGNENMPQRSSRTIPVLTSVSTTAYPHPEPEMIKDEAYTYFPASVPGENHLLRWETYEGAKRTKNITELDLDFNGELLPGKKLVLNAVYLATPSMSLSPG